MTKSNKLIGFISAVPAHIKIYDKYVMKGLSYLFFRLQTLRHILNLMKRFFVRFVNSSISLTSRCNVHSFVLALVLMGL